MYKKWKDNTSLAHAILLITGELGMVTLNAFFPEKYAFARLWRPLLGLERSKKLKKKTISSTLWRLKQQRLVACDGLRAKSSWSLTTAGKKHIQDSVSKMTMARKSDGITRLVIFDIPEKQRRKRDIIRGELIGCGFRQLQKSVWIGNLPLEESFITLIDDLSLTKHVHIFSVQASGTLVT